MEALPTAVCGKSLTQPPGAGEEVNYWDCCH